MAKRRLGDSPKPDLGNYYYLGKAEKKRV